MENGRLVELMSDMLKEMKGMRAEMKEMRADIKEIRSDITGIRAEFRALTERVERLEKWQQKTNVLIQQLQLSVTRIADALDRLPEFDRRITRLEAAVFKN